MISEEELLQLAENHKPMIMLIILNTSFIDQTVFATGAALEILQAVILLLVRILLLLSMTTGVGLLNLGHPTVERNRYGLHL
jgi:hypothetical protein